MKNLAGKILALVISAVIAASAHAVAQTPITLKAQFTRTPITIDGTGSEAAWSRAVPLHIGIAMNNALTAPAPASCTTSGDVRALWDGNLLYLLITVSDLNVTTASVSTANQDSVEAFLDLWNDKMSKFEEDDGVQQITAAGKLGTQSSGVYLDRLHAFASAPIYNAQRAQIGYNVELAINTGGLAMRNGTTLGMEFGILDASAPTNTAQCKIFWSNGKNQALNDNSIWGDVVLTGYDGFGPLALDTYVLNNDITIANSLTRGIWRNERELNLALAQANDSLNARSQFTIDWANSELDRAIKDLRRKGKYPDPFELPSTVSLPDPFTFFNGRKVNTLSDWSRRSAEIKDLAQYYEYGYMPNPPQSLTAVSTSGAGFNNVAVNITDKGNTASFTARLTLPKTGPNGQPGGPYPVIVELDQNASTGNSALTAGGYAVLSIPTYSIYSDNILHTGAFFTLYPYNVATGNDPGMLLGWAWGASRGVDALQYLAAHDPTYAGLLDLNKLVVTGFSRWGKATLVAGLLDDRFGVVNPGGAGSGGPTPYRYDSYGNKPARSAPFGNVYPWGQSTGAEVLGDHVWHNPWNSNEMLARFLAPVFPSPLVNTTDTAPAMPQVGARIFAQYTHGYANRLPYDHHELVAAIAPRAVLIDASNNDYADNAEGDSIGFAGAQPVYEFLGASQNLAFDLSMLNAGHSLSTAQRQNMIAFANMVFYGTPLPSNLQTSLYDNPYVDAGVYNTYYGGFRVMAPWASHAPHANLLTSLKLSGGLLLPAFNENITGYQSIVSSRVSSITLTPTSEDPKATITVAGQTVPSGQSSPAINLHPGANSIRVVVTTQDGASKTYTVIINRL